MQIECEAKELRSALEMARQVSMRPAIRRSLAFQQYDFVTVEARNKRIVMLMSDGEVMVRKNIDGQTHESGIVMLPIKKGLAFARGERGKVALHADGDAVVLTGVNNGKVNLRMAQLKSTERLEWHDHGEASIVLGPEFARRLGWVRTMTAKEESRLVLTGVLLRLCQDGLVIVAADGFRLVRALTPDVVFEGEQKQLLIPRKACMLVSRYMNSDVRMGFNDQNVAWFETDDIRIVSALLNAQYPAYEQLFSTSKPLWKFSVSAPMLEARLRQFEPENSIVRLQQSDGFLKVSMQGSYDDDLFETLIPSKVEFEKGECKIGMNKYFVADAIRGFAEVTFEVTAPASPMKVYGDVDGIEVMIMPMFLEW